MSSDILKEEQPMRQGFCLESADSVRFGPEYSLEEQRRSQLILFGEMLCGILLGERFWSNAVFAFESKGLVSTLAAICRAFKGKKLPQTYFPFCLAVYPGDGDTFTGNKEDWRNPEEVLLRCYANRLNSVVVKDDAGRVVQDGFQLSATPSLNENAKLRKALAEQMRQMALDGSRAEESGFLSLLEQETLAEVPHFQDVFEIDAYLKELLGDARKSDFGSFMEGPRHNSALQLNNDGWQDQYKPNSITRLRPFLLEANEIMGRLIMGRLPSMLDQVGVQELAQSAQEILKTTLELEFESPENDPCRNRTAFRNRVREILGLGQEKLGDCTEHQIFRTLIELADGHYMRTQYTELTLAAREVTSPASDSLASRLGEELAKLTTQACLKDPQRVTPWRFVSNIACSVPELIPHVDMQCLAEKFSQAFENPSLIPKLQEMHNGIARVRRRLSESKVRYPALEKECRALSETAHGLKDIVNNIVGPEVQFSITQSKDRGSDPGSIILSMAYTNTNGPADANSVKYSNAREIIGNSEDDREFRTNSLDASQSIYTTDNSINI